MLCTLALVLLLDASASILPAEWRLQVEGHAAALEDEDVVRAIERSGPIAVAALAFSDDVRPMLNWTALRSAADARDAARALRAAARPPAQGTDIAAALWAGMELLAESPCVGVGAGEHGQAAARPREMLDLVTDGEAPEAPVHQARAYAEAQEVTINALGVGAPEAEAWLRNHAITPDGFAPRAESWEDFPRAFRRKLLTELALARASSHAR